MGLGFVLNKWILLSDKSFRSDLYDANDWHEKRKKEGKEIDIDEYKSVLYANH